MKRSSTKFVQIMPLGFSIIGSTVTFDLFLRWATQGPLGPLVLFWNVWYRLLTQDAFNIVLYTAIVLQWVAVFHKCTPIFWHSVWYSYKRKMNIIMYAVLFLYGFHGKELAAINVKAFTGWVLCTHTTNRTYIIISFKTSSGTHL